jgi:hypothetical protein
VASGFEGGDGVHLASDFEDEVVFPLHLLGRVRETQTIFPEPFDVHERRLSRTGIVSRESEGKGVALVVRFHGFR